MTAIMVEVGEILSAILRAGAFPFPFTEIKHKGNWGLALVVQWRPCSSVFTKRRAAAIAADSQRARILMPPPEV